MLVCVCVYVCVEKLILRSAAIFFSISISFSFLLIKLYLKKRSFQLFKKKERDKKWEIFKVVCLCCNLSEFISQFIQPLFLFSLLLSFCSIYFVVVSCLSVWDHLNLYKDGWARWAGKKGGFIFCFVWRRRLFLFLLLIFDASDFVPLWLFFFLFKGETGKREGF